MFQRQAKAYLNDVDDIFPIYLKNNSISSLKNIIEKEYLFDNNSKYIVFVDGLDELDYSLVDKIIDEAMFLEELWSNCRFILTTRPMSLISNDNMEQLPALKDDEIIEIIKCICGKEYTTLKIEFGLDKDIKNAIKRPFFCILFALSIKDNDNIAFDRNKMIDYLVNKSLLKLSIQKEKIYNQLIRLSIIFIDKRLGKIHLSELGSSFDIDNLLKSGLIYKDNNEYLYFPLPIIPQWLSAEGLRLQYKSIDEIIKSEEQIIKWRYSLSILFGKLTYEESKSIFAKIVSTYPGVASIIIRDGIKTKRQSELPIASECGEMLQECMKTWIKGLGNLAYIIAPFKNGKIADIGIDVDGIGISVSWNRKSYKEDIREFIGRDLLFWGGSMKSYVPIAQAIWPWVDTLEYLSENLKQLIKQRPLLLQEGILLDEYIWKISCILTNRGSLYDEDIFISEIEKYRKYSYANNFMINNKTINLNFYFAEIDKLIDKGQTFINVPWPKHDLSYGENGGFVWEPYSDKKILEKTIFIYENAMKEYLKVVEKWFPLIKENFSIYNILPAKLNGDIHISRKNGYQGCPTMDWYYEILPKGENSCVNFNLVDKPKRHEKLFQDYSHIRQEMWKKRREKSEWIDFSSGGKILDIFGDNLVTNVVFEWLEDDLKRIGWLK